MIYWYEIKKLVFAPAIVGFILLCLLLNTVIILSSNKESIHNMDVNTVDMIDIFDGYDVSEIAERYIAKLNITGNYEENIRKKYDNLQASVNEKGERDESLSLYFGIETRYIHKLLFQKILGIITIESCLIALFVALLSTGYEHNRNTECIVYTSKTGRKIQRKKFLAVLIVAEGCFLCLLVVTLLLYFLCFDYAEVWHDSVSSLFNSSVSDLAKPFITWQSVTVLQLIIADCAISAGLVTCFAWIGFSIGIFFRNEFRAVAVSVGICIFLFVIEPIFPYGSQVRNLLNLTPVRLLANIGDWFTDGYANILWRNFECWGSFFSLITLAGITSISMTYFARRDLT